MESYINLTSQVTLTENEKEWRNLMRDTLYIKLKNRLTIAPNETVTLGQIADLYCENQKLLQEVQQIKAYVHRDSEGNRAVIEALDTIKFLKSTYDSLQIEVIGEPHTLIIIEAEKSRKRPVVFAICWLILFFGSGLAIMNFHSDVNMYDTQVRIVELLTGEVIERPLWFQIPYSIGVGVGMLLFFNHTFKKRKNEEPNPLEVEMYLYQENVNSYVIADEIRRKRQT